MINLLKADITKLEVDAIVNAANKTLLGGGGVDGAIHGAAGPQLLAECTKLKGCATGQAKITRAYALPARHVIHTVGPVWKGGMRNEESLLRSCYLNSLSLAKEYKLESIAFPNISTGVYEFPKNLAAEIAINAVKEFLTDNELPQEVYFACFDEENYQYYKNLL